MRLKLDMHVVAVSDCLSKHENNFLCRLSSSSCEKTEECNGNLSSSMAIKCFLQKGESIYCRFADTPCEFTQMHKYRSCCGVMSTSLLCK